MTEAQWNECADPQPMLDFLRDKAIERKLRLFGMACCCRILRLLTDQRSVNAILVTDRYLHGAASREELDDAERAARQAYLNAFQNHDNAAYAAASLAINDPYHAAGGAAAYAVYAVGHERAAGGGSVAEVHEKYTAGQDSERTTQATLLRHIVGDPFHPFAAPAFWPSVVVQLADAFSKGEDCGFALHDALIDAGYTELALHFRDEPQHPKGCWAVDLLLGKE